MKFSRTAAVLAGALVIVGGANVAVFAANGGSFILGQSNSETKASVLTSTGSGPALTLKAQGAPLAVSNSKKVVKLNADEVDGKNASDLGTKVWTAQASGLGPFTAFYADFQDIPQGTYLVTYTVEVNFGSAGTNTFDCGLIGDVDEALDVTVSSAGSQYARCTETGIVTIGAGPSFSGSGSAVFGVVTAQWTFMRLNSVATATANYHGVL